MRYLGAVFKAKIGIRGRILSIALAPSLALLVTGVIIAGLLLVRGTDSRDWAARVDRDSAPGIDFTIQIQEERRLTLLLISGDDRRRPDLAKQRGRVDAAVATLIAAGAAFTDIDPGLLSADVAKGRALAGQLPAIRQRADTGTLPAAEAYSYFSSIITTYIGSTELLARAAPTPDTSTELAAAARLLRVAETMSRANAFATAAFVRGDLTTENQRQFAYDIGFYRSELAALGPHLPTAEQSTLAALTTGPAWQHLSTMEDAIADRPDLTGSSGSGATAESRLPLNVSEWQDTSKQVSVALLDLWRTHYRYALHWAREDGAQALRQALFNGATILVIALGAFLLAARLATRLIRRLRRLQQETLALADDQLPEITERLREGRPVDTDETARLQFGNDEIGQVAEAFNRAHAAAVAAAVAEAQTRAGFNAVFFNIAYRSQMIIHRLLAALDKAERHQEDPAQLDLLFRLDHLATRARRNAENLIILGGGRPGRQWRAMVPLIDLIRSAVAETEHYRRVTVTRVPEAAIAGNVVADLIHLLAELVDNATAFSPPECSVEITAQVVGKGIAIDVSDQGLGMPEHERELANETLRNPPDFSLSSLTGDSRLGLFVVARLALQHRISVRLTESSYGGIRAIVLLPTSMFSDAREGAESDASAGPHEIAPPPSGNALMAVATPSPRGTSISAPTLRNSAPIPISSTAPPFALEPGASDPTRDDRPQLPRRRRQANLAPELAKDLVEDVSPQPDPGSRHRNFDRDADQARDLMSAIEAGTRQGRQPISDSDPFRSDYYQHEGPQ
ncbi:sensor histidine kinase [Nocardia sp. CA-151230]|uniref:sensor histidine kinase n=1 Tax=Nocardia sp. CA-151230 TaxID=3239982 RepID=UPI003D8E6C76